jgi:PST family polysaccharide transporter
VGVAVGLSLVFFWSGLTFQHEALLSRQMRQGELAVIRLLASLISIALAVLLALADWGYWALVWKEVAGSALIAIGVWVRCPWLPGVPKRHVGTRSLVRFGGELSATSLFTGLIANIDKLLIGRIFGAAPVGLYRQAQQLLLAPIDQLNGPILSVGQPALSALQADPARYRRYYEKIVFLVTLTTLPLGLLVAVYAEEVTLLFLGPEWRHAAVFVCIFSVAAMIRPAIGTSAVVLVSCGHSRRFFVLAVAHGVVLSLLLLLGVNWGAEGVALAHVATTVVLMAPKLYFSFLKTPATLQSFVGAIRAPVVAGVLMGTGLIALRGHLAMDNALLSLLAGASAGCALYVVGLWVQPNGRNELRSLAKDLRAGLERKRRGPVAGIP